MRVMFRLWVVFAFAWVALVLASGYRGPADAFFPGFLLIPPLVPLVAVYVLRWVFRPPAVEG
jgi:hypothetical protein